MALALVKYEDIFQLVSGYLYGARGAPTGMTFAYQVECILVFDILLVTPWSGVHAY